MRLYGVVLASLLVFAVADVHGIKVLWMNGEPEKPDMKGKGSAVDDSTDKLLQEAIRNIDQLTNVARSLSQENVAKPPVKSPSRPKVQPKMMMQSKTSPPPTMPSSCRVTFKLKNDQTQPGDTVLAIGSVGALGLWKPDGALKFKTDGKSFPIWTAEVSLPLGTDLDFKFVMQRSSGDLQWENGDNRKLTVPKAAGVTVEGGFGQGGLKTKETGPVAAATAASAPPAAGGGVVESNQRGSSSGTARLHFRVRCETQKGEAVSVCGSLPTIGSWNPKSALPLKTSKDEYPYWSGSTDVALSQVQDMLRYKYLVKKGNEQKWEDAIADRTVKPENKPKGVLAPGLDTFVDDGHFNQLQRVCTYVRDSSEQRQRAGAAQSTAITTTQSPAQVPAGMQLVSLDQIRQWEARVTELEGECEELRERAKSAETTVDALNRDLEEERRQNEEIMHQMQFVEELLTRMKKMEDQVTNLEETKEVLVTRSESMGNLQDMNVPTTNRGSSVVESIDKGLSGAKQILNNINNKLPAKT